MISSTWCAPHDINSRMTVSVIAVKATRPASTCKPVTSAAQHTRCVQCAHFVTTGLHIDTTRRLNQFKIKFAEPIVKLSLLP
jgi:hypothetical protein